MIRLATPADLSQAAEIYEEILDQEQQGPVYTNWQRGKYPTIDTARQAQEAGTLYVGEEDGVLWGVADCRIDSPLEGEELRQLVSYLSGQASDGWGEGFEQRPIFLDEEELYVHLWQGQNWEMSQEAAPPQQDASPSMGMVP